MAQKRPGDDDDELKKEKKTAGDGLLCFKEGAASQPGAICATPLEEMPANSMPQMSAGHTSEVDDLRRDLAKQREDNEIFQKRILKLLTDREEKDMVIDVLRAEIDALKKKAELDDLKKKDEVSAICGIEEYVKKMHDYWKGIHDRQELSVERLEFEAQQLRRDVQAEKDRSREFSSKVLTMVEQDRPKEQIVAFVRGQEARSVGSRLPVKDCISLQESPLTKPEQESDTGQTQYPRYVGAAEQKKMPTVFSHRVVDVPLQSPAHHNTDNKSSMSSESPKSLLVVMSKLVLTPECRGNVRDVHDYSRCQVLGPIFTGKLSPFPNRRSASPAPDSGNGASAAGAAAALAPGHHRLHHTLVVSDDIMAHDVAARLDITAEMIDAPENRFLLHPRVAHAYARGHLTIHPVCSSPDQLATPLALQVKVLHPHLLDDAAEVADSGRRDSVVHAQQGRTVTFKGIDGCRIRGGLQHCPTPRLELLALHNWFALVSALRDKWLRLYSVDERCVLLDKFFTRCIAMIRACGGDELVERYRHVFAYEAACQMCQ